MSTGSQPAGKTAPKAEVINVMRRLGLDDKVAAAENTLPDVVDV